MFIWLIYTKVVMDNLIYIFAVYLNFFRVSNICFKFIYSDIQNFEICK